MITGSVSSDREAMIRLIVLGRDGERQEVDCMVDIGFNGFLTLPHSTLQSLGSPLIGGGRALLANGQEELFDIYGVTLEWEGANRVVETDAADTTPLVGMSLLYGMELNIQIIDGGNVSINPFP